MPSLSASIAALRSASKASLARRGDEERPSLQLIVLLLAWWVALALGWIGTPPLLWIGGGLLITVGHLFSWLFRNSRSPIRTGIVALAVVGALALVPRTIVQALNGDWLPVAHFLLLFQGITSFEMRTRGGMYASIGISGAIFFFVSQQALDITFGVFLTGFTTLLLSFFALSFLMDQVRDADVRWFRGRFSFALFWTGVFVAAMIVSAAIFLMLPKDFKNPANGAEALVLPMRASGNVALPEISPNFAEAASALPFRPGDGRAEDGGATPNGSGGPASPEDQNPTGAPNGTDGTGDDPDAPEGGTGAGGGVQGGAQGPKKTLSQEQGQAGLADDTLVMQVRSPVMTYWRSRVFDTFDGENWYADEDALKVLSSGATRTVYGAPQPPDVGERPLYNQTFFVKQPMPQDSLLTGYAAVVATVPAPHAPDGELPGGTIYRVISAIPEFNAEGLAGADPSSRLDRSYHKLPASSRSIRGLARQLTAGSFNDAERMRRILAYLDRDYKLDASAADQLKPSKTPEEFLTERASGTTMDFAAATVLLARAAGIPARLVTGYLPGHFDPLSGTYMVYERDRHAWAEAYFGGVGWVPFDSAPRPDASAFGEGGTQRTGRVNTLLRSAYGDDFYSAVRESPERIMEFITSALSKGVTALAVISAISTLASLGAFIFWKVRPMSRSRRPKLSYVRLGGGGRDEALRAYAVAERLLRGCGLPRRSSAQTLGEYSAVAEAWLGGAMADLVWLRSAAWAAAYNPSPFDAGAAAEARQRLSRLKASIRAKRGQVKGR